MGRLLAALYDRMMASTERACLSQWRAGLLDGLDGVVLEVGAGTGVNLPHYPPGVTRLVASEPDPHMRRRLVEKVRAMEMHHVEVIDAGLEALPLADEQFDAVVCTLVLCSVPDPDVALAEIHRVLTPGGRLVFLEHVAARDRPARLRWQRRLEPLWKRVAGGCHLTRRTAEAIARAGFTIPDITRESMRKSMPIVRPTIRGIAVKEPRP